MSFAFAKRDYDENGFTIIRNAIDSALASEACAHISWLQSGDGEKYDAFMLRDHPDAFFYQLVSDSRLLDIAEQFIGPNIALLGAGYFSKRPIKGLPVLWHQDGSHWPLDPVEVVSIWLAVDPSTPENGCMQVIPGTHLGELQKIKSVTDVPNILNSSMDESLVDETKAVDIILNPGDVSIHHPNIIHGSKANRSPHRRCGLAIRYIPTTTRILDEKWPTSYLLRGKERPGINSYLAPPTNQDFKVSHQRPELVP